MSWIIWILFFGALIYFLPKVLPAKGVKVITPDELKKNIEENQKKQYIDVRSIHEFNKRHIKPFKNIPLEELEQRIEELNPAKPVVVLCHSGMRGMTASRLLKKKGFEHIENVSGGINAYRE